MLRISQASDLPRDNKLWDTRIVTSSFAIIGAGVRGTAALGRLAAKLRAEHRSGPLELHVIDPYEAGAGKIWRTGQARSLVMNTVAAQSTVFDDPSLDFAESFPGPTFYEWCRAVSTGEVTHDDRWTRAQAALISPWSSPPRALYGRYLSWAFATFAAALPSSVRLTTHRAKAIALRQHGTRYQISLSSGEQLEVTSAVLALGWLERPAQPGGDITQESPIDQGIHELGAGERVVVRGVGMGFTDVLSLVTEERGGAFETDPSNTRPGALNYHPSGAEPKIFAGSRTGLPFLAKPAFGAVPPSVPFTALRAALPRLLHERPVDFRTEVLPLIEHAAAQAYYETLARHQPELFMRPPAELLAQFELPPGGHSAHWRSAETRSVPQQHRFRAERVLRPLRGRTAAALHTEITTRIEQDAEQAALGFTSAHKVALHSYQAARAAIIPLTEFAGVSHSSRDCLNRYLNLANLAGSGPPLFRIEQLLALQRTGVVTFIGPQLTIAKSGSGRVAYSAQAATETVPFDRLLDARLDLPSPEYIDDALIRSLLDAGLARIWPDSLDRQTLEITAEHSALVGASGTATPGLHSLGPLHEELRRFTIIAPIPGARSTVLQEIDAAITAALAHARRAPTTNRQPEVML